MWNPIPEASGNIDVQGEIQNANERLVWIKCCGPGSFVRERGPTVVYWRYRKNRAFVAYALLFVISAGLWYYSIIFRCSEILFWGGFYLAGFCGAVLCLALFCCGARDEEQAHYSCCWPVQSDGTITTTLHRSLRDRE